MAESRNDLGTAVRTFFPKLLNKRGLTAFQYKTLQAIANCRTEKLGGSVLACSCCGTVKYVFHSCRNRHCPQCQGIEKELWIEKRKAELLPTKYYHVVFTVPHELLELFRYNRKVMYGLLFEKSWQTLNGFAQNPEFLGATPGAISILHTWDQQLKFHPHIHMIVPAGGLDKNNKWKNSKQNGQFLFDVKEMSKVFSATFAKKLRQLKREGKVVKKVPKDLIKKPWVVYAKKAFGSPQSILEYLGRYTHRVAISNYRILKVDKHSVTFQWLDRKNNYQKNIETIDGARFLERFVDHIIPPGFRRIRHLGFLSNRNKEKSLTLIREQFDVIVEYAQKRTRAEIAKELWGEQSQLHCKACGGEMVVIKTYTKQRAPPCPA